MKEQECVAEVLRNLPPIRFPTDLVAGSALKHAFKTTNMVATSGYQPCEGESWKNIMCGYRITLEEAGLGPKALVSCIQKKRSEAVKDLFALLEQNFIALAGLNSDDDWLTYVLAGWWLKETMHPEYIPSLKAKNMTITEPGPQELAGLIVFIDSTYAFGRKEKQ